MAFYERQPFIQPLYQIVTEIMSGEIQVPRFQRAGTQTTWSAEQRGDLLDSLYRGYPIGTILLWSTTDKIKIMNKIGGYKISEPTENSTLRLLLDGHQRLSTLVQILGTGLESDVERTGKSIERDNTDDNEEWFFELNATGQSSRERFILLKSSAKPEKTQLPLDILLNRAKLNRWMRERDLSDDQIKDADDLRDRLREYSIPVAVLVADSLDEATVSFKRINSSGTPMDDFNMVAALSFQKDFDLREIFESAKARFLLELGHWHDTPDLDLLRICTGILDDAPNNIKVESLAKKLDHNLIETAVSGAANACKLLMKCGIHGPEILPYSWQLITLAIVLEKNKVDRDNDIVYQAVEKWFWLTTYGEVFAGVNGAIYNRSSIALLKMLSGGNPDEIERDITRKVRSVQRFDFRAVRSKAYALLMARQYDDNNKNGAAHKALATGRMVIQPLSKDGRRSNWSDLVIIPSEQIKDIREVCRKKEQGIASTEDEVLLKKYGVMSLGSSIISMDDLLKNRESFFVASEKSFVEGLGLEWSSY